MASGHLGRPEIGRHRLVIRPTTRLGNWAVALAAADVLLVLAWKPLAPVGAPLGFACGLAGGAIGLTAILRRGERAVAVFAALVPFLFVVVFLIAELVGHD